MAYLLEITQEINVKSYSRIESRKRVKFMKDFCIKGEIFQNV